MEIKQQDDSKKGRFIILEGETEAGRVEYVWNGPDMFIIEHTEVHPDFGGKGIGLKLVRAAAEYARKEQKKILPLCPFAKSVFDRSPSEYSDIRFLPS